MTIAKGSDGFYHPSTEAELVELVKQANQTGKQVRVRGAAHSVACAVYTDPCTERDNRVEHQTPPPGDELNVMLDRYRRIWAVDKAKLRVEVEAGIHLGADPSDPTGTATLETSLLYQLWKDYGLMVSDLGGITHQTVGGFLSTGSSGGSLTYSIGDNLYGLRLIDGQGNVYEVSRDDANPDEFHAVAVSMGLLGVISRVTFQCVPTFNISGQEAITTYADASLDLFGDGSSGKPALEQFLKTVEYTRLDWWPQRGGERVVTWQCQRITPQPGFRPARYTQFGDSPEVTELALSIFLTILGNLDDLSQARDKLAASFDQLQQVLDFLAKAQGLGVLGEFLATAIRAALQIGVDAAILFLQPLAPIIKNSLPDILPSVLNLFMPLDSSKPGITKGEPQSFRDYGWSGLPMDNQASDVLVPTEFTEFWIPIGYSQQVMSIFKNYFDEPPSGQQALARTGTYAWELYGAKPSSFWLSMSYTDGKDEWRDGCLRVDIFWFTGNAGDPAAVFYPQFWKLLRDRGIPYRLHWGKFQPIIPEGDPEGWAAFFKRQYGKWDDFLALRAKKDPKNVFLTHYWRSRFGL